MVTNCPCCGGPPPQAFCIQEAYQNPDGTYAEPHWDEWCTFEGQRMIDDDELVSHLAHLGEWEEMFQDITTDPRPCCRRVADVRWGKEIT